MKYPITAQRLRAALNKKNMRAQELADKTEINKASISQYINGSHAPSNISAGKMAKVLSVSPLWLMGFDVPEKEYVGEIERLEKEIYKKNSELIEKIGNETERHRIMSDLEDLRNSLRQLEEAQKTYNQEEEEHTKEALELYRLYEKADPSVRLAIETLLKGKKEE